MVPKAAALAEKILNAAGSGLRHYTEESRREILKAAQEAIKNLNKEPKK